MRPNKILVCWSDFIDLFTWYLIWAGTRDTKMEDDQDMTPTLSSSLSMTNSGDRHINL